MLPELSPALAENLKTEIVIVGAGIAGLTTAYLLAREGRKVVVLDSGPPGGGMTSRTSGHLSNALDDRWFELIELRGLAESRLAAGAHCAAINLIEKIQADETIDCDFARVDGFLVQDPDNRENLDRELKAAHKLGLTDVEWAEGAPFPGHPGGKCLRFPRQARFHAIKFLRGLIASIERQGGRLLTAHVNQVASGKTPSVTTDTGLKVEATAVVIATNAPIHGGLAIHAKQAPYRSYVTAAPVPKGSVPDVLCWDTGEPYHYTRLHRIDAQTDLLIVGGEDHKSGQETGMAARFTRLTEWTRARFPSATEFTYRWSGQVMENIDYLSFSGHSPGEENVYVHTGDSGMGLTHGAIGAMIIADLIAGRGNDWARLFDPARQSAKAAIDFVSENLNVASQFLDYITSGDVASAAKLKPGQGAIIRRGMKKIAAYRAEDGSLSERSATCPHMGCIVAWNPMERCWDCPCHGSQFAATGEVISGPATTGLAPATEAPPEK